MARPGAGGARRGPRAASVLPSNPYGYTDEGTDLHLCTGPMFHSAPLVFSVTAPLAFGVGTVSPTGSTATATTPSVTSGTSTTRATCT